MSQRFEPKIEILPSAQKEIWQRLAPAPSLSLVLYGGTAIALHLGHRISVDFDFFSAAPLEKSRIEKSFPFVKSAQTIIEDPNTLVIMTNMPSGPVRVSFFGGVGFGHVNEPLETSDSVLLVASLDDLLATKLKAILDRAEAKDYRDIAAILSNGVSLEKGLAAFSKMFNKDPALPLRALGFFKDGDLPTLPEVDQKLLRSERNRIVSVPELILKRGLFSA